MTARSATRLLSLAAVGLTTVSFASLDNPRVVEGTAEFNRQGSHTDITTSNLAIIEYDAFDIAAHESVEFIQPDADSMVLNRILGSDNPSLILGELSANGRIYLVNPAGVIFGADAVVNVGQIYAAAGTMSNEDFMAGLNQFGNLEGEVANFGYIEGSAIHLLGREVINRGQIVATNGVVTMTAGDEVFIGEANGNIFVSLRQDAPGGEVGVENTGEISAEGGSVFLGAGDLYSVAVRQSGIVEASSVQVESVGGRVEVEGEISASDRVELLGEEVGLYETARVSAANASGGGEILIGGDVRGENSDIPNARAVYLAAGSEVSASAGASGNGGRVIIFAEESAIVRGAVEARGSATGSGGFIETSGLVYLDISAVPNAGAGGTWLIDPFDVDITATPGGSNSEFVANVFQPIDNAPAAVEVDVAQITAALAGGTNVTVTTTNAGAFVQGADAGDLRLLADLGVNLGAGAAVLTLNADNNLTLSNPITATGNTLGLNLQAGATGAISVEEAIDLNGGNLTATGQSFAFAGAGSLAANTLDTSGIANAVTLNLANLTALTTYLGSAANDDVLIATANDETFTFNGGANDVTLGGTSFSGIGEVQAGDGADTFSVIVATAINLQGGVGDDLFDLDAVPTGLLMGGTGRDTLDLAGIVGAGDVVLSARDGEGNDGLVDGALAFDGFTRFSGKAGATFTGLNLDTLYEISNSASSANDLDLTADVQLQGFTGGLTTGGGVDRLTAAAGTVTGNAAELTVLGITATGLDSADLNDGTLTGTAGDDVFSLTGTEALTAANIAFTNVTTIEALGQATADDLTANGAALNGAGSLLSNGITVNGIETTDLSNGTLTGTAGDDTFVVQSNGDVLAESITHSQVATIEAGESGSETVGDTLQTADVDAGTQDLTIVGTESVSVSGVTANQVENVSVDQVLIGTANDDTFVLDGADTVASAGIAFSRVDEIQGQNGNDAFSLTADSAIALVGGDGADEFDLTGFNLTADISGGNDASVDTLIADFDVTLTTVANEVAFAAQLAQGIEAAQLSSSTLNGSAAGDVVTITASGELTANQIAFTQVASLAMGAGADAITVTNNAAFTSITLGAGDDAITINDGFILTLDNALDGGTEVSLTGDALIQGVGSSIDAALQEANQIALSGGATPEFTGFESFTTEAFTLGGANDGNFLVNANGTITVTTVADTFTLTNTTTLTGGLGGDTLSMPDIQALASLNFNGGGQAGDSIDISDPLTVDSVTHAFLNASDGSITVDLTGGGTSVINYTGLAPIRDNLTATDRVFTFLGGDEMVTLTNTGATLDLLLDSTLGESVDFRAPTSSMTLTDSTGNFELDIRTSNAIAFGDLIIQGGVGTLNLDALEVAGTIAIAVTNDGAITNVQSANPGDIEVTSSLSLQSFADAISLAAAGNHGVVDVGGNLLATAAGNIAIGTATSANFQSVTFQAPGQSVTISEGSASILSGDSDAATLALDAFGSITDDGTADLAVTGMANFSAAGPISLDDTHAFGALTFNSPGAVVINETGNTLLTSTSTADSLTLASTGSITDDGSVDLSVTNNASFSANGAITLDDTHAFGSLAFNTSGVVTIFETGDTVLSGTSTANALTLTSTGSITDDGTADLAVSSSADLTAAGLVALVDAYAFGTLTFNGGAAVTLFENGDTVLSGTSSATSLALTTTGSLTDDGTANLAIANNAAFNASNPITLDDTYAFGSLTFNTGAAVSVTEVGDTLLSGSSTAGSLALTSTGTILDDGSVDLVVTNNASFQGTAITLDDGYAFGSLTFNAPGTVSISENGSMQLSGASAAADLMLAGTNEILDDATADLTVSGDGTLIANNTITLNDQAGNVLTVTGLLTLDAASASIPSAGTTDFGSLALFSASAGDFVIREDGAMQLALSEIASGSATLTATDLRVLGDARAEGGLTLTATGADGEVNLGGDGDILVEGILDGGTGDVTMTAGRIIAFAEGSAIADLLYNPLNGIDGTEAGATDVALVSQTIILEDVISTGNQTYAFNQGMGIAPADLSTVNGVDSAIIAGTGVGPLTVAGQTFFIDPTVQVLRGTLEFRGENIFSSLGDVIFNVDDTSLVDPRTNSARPEVPLVATLISRDLSDLAIVGGGNIAIGVNEKLTVFGGNLALLAIDDVYTGDLSVQQSLDILADRWVVQGRERGQLLDNGSLIGGGAFDQGVDVIAQTINVDATAVLDSAGSGQDLVFITFANNALNSGQSFQGDFLALQTLVFDDYNFTFGSLAAGYGQDVVAEGALPANVGRAIAGAVPELIELQFAVDSIDAALLRALQEIGVFARPNSSVEAVGLAGPSALFLQGLIEPTTRGEELLYARSGDRGTFRQLLQLVNNPQPSDFEVAEGRVASRLVREALENYYRVFYQTNEQGERTNSRFTEFSDTLREAYQSYTGGTSTPTGQGFARFTAERSPEAAEILRSVESVLGDLRRIGLTDAEYEVSSGVILRYLAPSGIPIVQLREAVDAISAGPKTQANTTPGVDDTAWHQTESPVMLQLASHP